MSDVSPKVLGGGVAGAVTTVLVWLMSLVGVEASPEVAAALTVLGAMGVGYRVTDPKRQKAEAEQAAAGKPALTPATGYR